MHEAQTFQVKKQLDTTLTSNASVQLFHKNSLYESALDFFLSPVAKLHPKECLRELV
jgi:hypothetical protein